MIVFVDSLSLVAARTHFPRIRFTFFTNDVTFDSFLLSFLFTFLAT